VQTPRCCVEQDASFDEEGCQEGEAGDCGDDAVEAAYEERLRRCMVQVEVDLPLVALADGVHSSSFAGAASGAGTRVCLWVLDDASERVRIPLPAMSHLMLRQGDAAASARPMSNMHWVLR